VKVLSDPFLASVGFGDVLGAGTFAGAFSFDFAIILILLCGR
jgi:hypothetical protein